MTVLRRLSGGFVLAMADQRCLFGGHGSVSTLMRLRLGEYFWQGHTIVPHFNGAKGVDCHIYRHTLRVTSFVA